MKFILLLACLALLVSCSASKVDHEKKRIQDSASYDNPPQKDSVRDMLQNELLLNKNKMAPVIF